MTHKLINQPFVTIQSKPTYEQLEARWNKLKEILQLTIDQQEEQDMHLLVDYIQILDEMGKLEGGEG